MKKRWAIAAVGMAIASSMSISPASAVIGATVVRPGSLHSWLPFESTGPNGRWVTGPSTPPLGVGSAQLKTGEALLYFYSSPLDLSTFVATYGSYGSAPAMFEILTDDPSGSQVLLFSPPAGSGWQPYDAMAGTWQWDCNGDGTLDGSGTTADFLAGCNATAKVAALALAAFTGNTFVDNVEIGPSGATTIFDMEPPQASVRNRSKTEGNTGTTVMKFVVKLSGPNDVPVSVHYATANGTAIKNTDYLPTSGTLKIKPGTGKGIIKVTIVGDILKEPNETFKLKLSAPRNTTLKVTKVTGTILNDD